MHKISLLKMKADRLSREAVVSADDIVTQHNLFSSATDVQRMETLGRLLDWMNGPRLLAMEALKELEEAIQPRDSVGALEQLRATLREASVD